MDKGQEKGPAGPHLNLELSAVAESVALGREAVRSLLASCGWPAPTVRDVELALDEALSNVVEHGYRGQPGRSLWLSARFLGPDLELVVEDEAPFYDPTRRPRLDVDVYALERPDGGWGVHLMRTLMDAVEHRARSGGGNTLVLRKKGPQT